MEKHFTLAQFFGLGKQLGLTPAEAKQAAYSLTGKDSMTLLKPHELDTVCWELIARKHSKRSRPGMATDRQLYKIAEYERELGWDKESERLRGFLTKFHHVEDVKWLSAGKASKVIDGLKAMAAKVQAT